MDPKVRKYKYIFINRIGVVIEFTVRVGISFVRVMEVDMSQSMVNTVEAIYVYIGFRHIVSIYCEVGGGDVEGGGWRVMGYLFHVDRVWSNMALQCFT